MTGAELGALLDADDTSLEISTNEHVEALLIIAKVRDLDTGHVSVTIAHTSDTDPVTQLGLIAAAADITSGDWHKIGEDDET
jgi:hypothetical protein